MIGTLSVSSACHAHNHDRVLHSLSCQANISINLMCSRIYDAFDQMTFDRLLRFSLLTVLLY